MDIHLHQDYTLNPDGSARVTVLWRGDAPNDLSPETFMATEVAGSKGIDAWCSISCDIAGGKLKFQAVVFVKDIGALRFHCQGMHANVLDFTASLNEAGNLVVKTPVPELPTVKLLLAVVVWPADMV